MGIQHVLAELRAKRAATTALTTSTSTDDASLTRLTVLRDVGNVENDAPPGLARPADTIYAYPQTIPPELLLKRKRRPPPPPIGTPKKADKENASPTPTVPSQPSSKPTTPPRVPPSILRTRPKTPSPLASRDDSASSSYTSSPSQVIIPRRHAYPHRGLSRSALCHAKMLWEFKAHNWVHERERTSDGAYDGANVEDFSDEGSSFLSDSSSSSASTADPQTPEKQTSAAPPPNPAIFPRAGDLGALHEPSCGAVDYQRFATVPMHTISHALWLHELEKQEIVQKVQVEEDPWGPDPSCWDVKWGILVDRAIASDAMKEQERQWTLATEIQHARPLRRSTKQIMSRHVEEPATLKESESDEWDINFDFDFEDVEF